MKRGIGAGGHVDGTRTAMRRHLLLIAIIGGLAVIGAALIGQGLVFSTVEPSEVPRTSLATQLAVEAPEPEAADEAAGQEAREEPLVLTVTTPGNLERLVDGSWERVPEGARLETSDRVRTRGVGRVVIMADDGTRVEMIDEVDVSVAQLTRSLTELVLREGRVRAELGDGSDLALRVRSSGALAEGRGGAFTVFADGQGMVAVASETATVRLEAEDEEVALGAREQSVVLPGSPPSDPEAISEEVFLNVAWPEERLQRSPRLVVRGRVRPGTEVRVAGQRAEVASDGAFEAPVELDAGPNRISVTARDPAGRSREERSPPITVRNRPPRLEVVSDGIWQE